MTSLINYIKDKFKALVNSLRIPRLIDIALKGWSTALELAPPAAGNWVRLGLENKWRLFFSALFISAMAFFNKVMGFIYWTIGQFDVKNSANGIDSIFIINSLTSSINLIDLGFKMIAIGVMVIIWFEEIKRFFGLVASWFKD